MFSVLDIILLSVLSFPIIRIILNFARFIRADNVMGHYLRWKNFKDESFSKRMTILLLLKYANIPDFKVHNAIGGQYTHIDNDRFVSVQKNIPNRYDGIFKHQIQMLLDCRDTFLNRLLSSFNPLFWLSKLGRPITKLLSFISGERKDSAITKIFDILFWLTAILISIFVPEIRKTLGMSVF